MRTIKLWGGTHSNEALGMDVADSLLADPISGIHAGIVNVRGRELEQRFVDINMNDGYPGNVASDIYEERRAVEVLRESTGYDMVIDLHAMNGGHAGSDFVGISPRGVSPDIYGFIKGLGLSNIVLLDFNALINHVDNGVLFDIPVGQERSNVPYWRQKLEAFVTAQTVQTASPDEFNWFRYCTGVHLDVYHFENLKSEPIAFEPVSDDLQAAYGSSEVQEIDGEGKQLYWLGHNLDPKNHVLTHGYWGELAVKIDPPFTT